MTKLALLRIHLLKFKFLFDDLIKYIYILIPNYKYPLLILVYESLSSIWIILV